MFLLSSTTILWTTKAEGKLQWDTRANERNEHNNNNRMIKENLGGVERERGLSSTREGVMPPSCCELEPQKQMVVALLFLFLKGKKGAIEVSGEKTGSTTRVLCWVFVCCTAPGKACDCPNGPEKELEGCYRSHITFFSSSLVTYRGMGESNMDSHLEPVRTSLEAFLMRASTIQQCGVTDKAGIDLVFRSMEL